MTPPPRGPRDLDFLLGQRRRRKRRHDRVRRRRRVAVLFAVLLCAVGVAAATVGFGGAAALAANCSLSQLRPAKIGQNSLVYAADGTFLGSIPAEKNRQPVELGQMTGWLPRATIAIEDRRFYEHGGVDYEGIARALWRDVNAGKVVEGGSTITQQLVRNLYISRERTVQRKLREACLAVKLSRQRSKQWILKTYLNTVYYGNHAYGVEAAAQTYFSRPASKLSLEQAALLAGLPQAPSVYDPINRPAVAIARRDEVLRALLDNGDISLRRYQRAVENRELHLRPGRLYTRIKEPYFFTYVQEELQREYGAETVRSGGLTIYTTIDPQLQRAANRAMLKILPYRTDPASAVVSIDPTTGAIKAMTALVRKKDNKFNLVSQSQRQPGSTFKTLALVTAVSEGINPDTTYYTSAPFHCSTGPWCIAQPWDVATYGHDYVGSTSITNATLRSDNTVFAQLTLDVGPDKVYRMARRFGIHMSPDKPVASIGLGSLSVSPLDMAAAYAALAANGIYSTPMAITKVIFPNGKRDKDAGWGRPKRKRIVADGTAWAVTQVLSKNIRYGTGYPNATLNRPSAGKTGTTENHVDAWFDGYTPDLATVVWMGYPQSSKIEMTNVHGISVVGGTFPAQIWHEVMVAALWNKPPRDFPPPKTYPTWRSYYERGHYSLGYVPSYTPSYSPSTTAATTTTATTTAAAPPAPPAKKETKKKKKEPEPPPATTAPPPPPPPATTEPPPATTEPPPPPPPTPDG
jgi:penicillin-binding protein 1A